MLGNSTNGLTFGGNLARYMGATILIAGTALRLAAVRKLGPRHSVWVALQHGHELLTTGPYRFIRHPSYAGALLAVFGWPLIFRSAPGLLLASLMLPPIIFRMDAEEQMLESEFGEDYAAYRRRTRRLVPLIY